MNTITRPIPMLLAGLLATGAFAAEMETITIKTLRAQMRYDVTDIDLRPGQKVKLVLQNDDDMPHNLCMFAPGSDVVAIANKQMDKPDEAVKRNFVPDDKSIWLHSKAVGPKESDTLEFTAPEKPGVYPYACTFPGHAAIMQGKMNVATFGPKLADLKFQLYLGSWKVLPKFSELKPHREGPVEDNLVQLKLDDYKNQFGIVFTGKLNAPKDGEYSFQVASDDGARVYVDGKQIVDNDGIHPSTKIAEGKVKLQKGDHEYRLEYFQERGQEELFAAWHGPGFMGTPLSKWVHPDWKGTVKPTKKSETTGMPLVVAQEPLVYRNFIAGAGNRGIGVGYPGNANIAWSAENFGLAVAWRGAFIDVARHWNGRGGGYQLPLGFDVIRPTGEASLPFAINPAPGSAWPTVPKGERAEGYSWKGYELDAKRYPTFHYEWQGVKVAERYEVEGDAFAGAGRLVRVLKLDGNLPAGAVLRVASGEIKPVNGGFAVNGGKFSLENHEFENVFQVSADGATVSGKDLLVPLRAEIKVFYSWPSAHAQHAHAK
jgi:azurin